MKDSNKRIIGICGNCGGNVTEFTSLHIVGPFPSPSCEKCGATPVSSSRPVLPMNPAPVRGQAYVKTGSLITKHL